MRVHPYVARIIAAVCVAFVAYMLRTDVRKWRERKTRTTLP
jgi:hypothetical protein